MANPYRPSCGTAGADFIDRWCYRCEHDRDFRENEGNSCPIVADTFVYDVDDPRYPKEWTFNDAGQPICTAFHGEGYPIPDPNQMDLPLDSSCLTPTAK